MKYIDFEVLWRNQKGPIFLDEKIAKFLFKQKEGVNFLSPLSGSLASGKSSKSSIFNRSPQFTFSHQLVLSGKNQWHIIDNAHKGKGGFGSVNESKYKIVVTRDAKNNRYQARLIPVNDVVKIQKPSENIPYSELLKRTAKEALRQKKHGVNVVGVVGTGDMVITILEDCGTSLDKLLPFTPSYNHSFQFRLEVAARIASEMLLLQQKEVVHRDLKPANICYKKLSNGQFLIIFIDFGLAEDVDSKDNLKTSGTLAYMAPEVILGRGSTYQSDMYALAAILGEIFGARHILKYKELASNLGDLARASYCFYGLFAGYDVSEVDHYLLEDIKTLLHCLQSWNPEKRPTIDQVNKFLITLPSRMDAYKNFNNQWAVMAKKFAEFEAYHQQMNLLKSKHDLLPFRNKLLHVPNPVSHVFNGRMLHKREEIYKEISTFALPLSHYELSKRLIQENRRADFENEDNPYPDLEKVIHMLEQENLNFKNALCSFNECVNVILDGNQLTRKFITTNSTGMRKIAGILSSRLSPLEQLEKLQQIGQAKTTAGFFYFFSHSKLLGKGRHENMEKLYQKLARIDPQKEQTEYLAKTQLDEITQFIQNTRTFTH
ncbi:protein kinase [Legionella anisa]|uniref:Protein kinase n=1 Tax=Legionella anisa TaxID=28082 RepID=A0AAX0WXZ2_9GAMM|nr:protein kinase [Legionella anisa]AWN72498.1 protein kinase [Legionella anisa]KTC74741.1 serine/threonine protein kinase [Legionella anisa]MCW8423265.1 protein kinase [Legionella anisa]MCW8446784.1 protein kinase [Legionella anisa]PNL62950.1 protein kinase [Legionella anisa]